MNASVTGRIRILLADDHTVLRDGLKALINDEPDLAVVAEAETGAEAVKLLLAVHPDVIVMDLGMPGMSGLEAITQIRQMGLKVKIVVLSMHVSPEIVVQTIRAGCDGYVPKSTAHTSLLHAIREVVKGRPYLHPIATSIVVDELTLKQDRKQLLKILSERELDVLKQTAHGFTGREIAENLSLSPKTVETYRQRAMAKLQLERRSDLIQFALEAGLLEEHRSA